jgi:hypothetical protein
MKEYTEGGGKEGCIILSFVSFGFMICDRFVESFSQAVTFKCV